MYIRLIKFLILITVFSCSINELTIIDYGDGTSWPSYISKNVYYVSDSLKNYVGEWGSDNTLIVINEIKKHPIHEINHHYADLLEIEFRSVNQKYSETHLGAPSGDSVVSLGIKYAVSLKFEDSGELILRKYEVETFRPTDKLDWLIARDTLFEKDFD